MKFSIIVPVYNVENYLDECIISLQNQDYYDYEIILIDDGSTDNSGIMCDKYSKNEDRIRVIHKKNGGLSDARNVGIENALGEYIIFVDSDDWIAPHSLYNFNEVIGDKKIDIIETRFIEVFDDKAVYCDRNLEKFIKDNSFSKESAIEWILTKTHNTWPAPKRIYSKEFLNRNKIRFLKGILHEDMDWTCKNILKAETYDVCLYPWYYHRMCRNGSITNTITSKNITDVIKIAAFYYNDCTSNSTDLKQKLLNRLMKSVYGKINQTKYCSDEDQQKVIECINKNKEIFCIVPKFKYKIFVFLMKVLGIDTTIKILNKL